MPIIRCPSCNDPVEIEDDWYGRRIACPSCDHKFTPRRSGRGEDDDRPHRRRDRDDDDRYDDRPRRSGGSGGGAPRSRRRDRDDPPPKKGNAVLWIVLSLVGVFVVLPCVACIGLMVWGNTATESFTGTWTDHSAGTPPVVTASFPKTPTPRYPAVSGSTGSEMIGYSNVNDGDNILDVEFAVGYLDFPAAGGDPLATHFPAIRKEVEQLCMANPLVPPVVARETTTAVGGYPAKEAVYNDDTGNHVVRVVHLNDRPPGSPVRLVVIVAGGPHLKDEDKQKFLNSVKIAGKK